MITVINVVARVPKPRSVLTRRILARSFSSTGVGGGDEGRGRGPAVKAPEWLNKERRDAQTHKGDSRSRGGRVGRWGEGVSYLKSSDLKI